MLKFSISASEQSPLTAPIPLCGNICESLEFAASLGYNAIEVHTRENADLDYEKILEVSEKCGIKICAIVTGRINTEGKVNLIDDAIYISNAAMDGMKKYINMAQSFDSDVVIGWAKGVVPEHGNREKYLKVLAQKIKELNDYGKERNIRIILEVINRYETNIFNTAQETVDFINNNRLDNCYVLLDTFHMGIDEIDPYQAIRTCGDKLGYMHVADNTRRHPGSGQIDFKRILSTLKEIGYQGYVNVECIPYPDRETAARKAIDHLKKCDC